MENEWADWIRYGKVNGKLIEIEISIDIDPPGAARPTRFDVEYTVREVLADGTRRIVQPTREVSFANEPNQTFDRVYFRTQPDGSLVPYSSNQQ